MINDIEKAISGILDEFTLTKGFFLKDESRDYYFDHFITLEISNEKFNITFSSKPSVSIFCYNVDGKEMLPFELIRFLFCKLPKQKQVEFEVFNFINQIPPNIQKYIQKFFASELLSKRKIFAHQFFKERFLITNTRVVEENDDELLLESNVCFGTNSFSIPFVYNKKDETFFLKRTSHNFLFEHLKEIELSLEKEGLSLSYDVHFFHLESIVLLKDMFVSSFEQTDYFKLNNLFETQIESPF